MSGLCRDRDSNFVIFVCSLIATIYQITECHTINHLGVHRFDKSIKLDRCLTIRYEKYRKMGGGESVCACACACACVENDLIICIVNTMEAHLMDRLCNTESYLVDFAQPSAVW